MTSSEADKFLLSAINELRNIYNSRESKAIAQGEILYAETPQGLVIVDNDGKVIYQPNYQLNQNMKRLSKAITDSQETFSMVGMPAGRNCSCCGGTGKS